MIHGASSVIYRYDSHGAILVQNMAALWLKHGGELGEKMAALWLEDGGKRGAKMEALSGHYG